MMCALHSVHRREREMEMKTDTQTDRQTEDSVSFSSQSFSRMCAHIANGRLFNNTLSRLHSAKSS